MGKSVNLRRAKLTLVFLFGCGIFAAAATPHLPVQSGARPDSTGGITGKVYFRGPKPKLNPVRIPRHSACASLNSKPLYPQDGQVNANGTLPYAFVYVERSSVALLSKPPKTAAVLTEERCQDHPHVTGVMVGQPFKVVNLDPSAHNVDLRAKINRRWDVTQPPGGAALVHRFRNPEVMIPIRSNSQPWMKAYLGVVKNEDYAVTGKNGTFSLKGLPPGKYTIEVWTALFGTQERRVTVRSGETATADFTFRRR